MKLFTIGHSNHAIECFIHLLHDNNIQQVVDVRSAPYSRFNPQFNRDALESALKRSQIGYIYEGKRLGGRPNDPSCYKSHKLPAEETDFLHEVNYPEVMRKAWFQQGIQKLLVLAAEQSTAILCSEEDPAQCHRHHLITHCLLDGYPEVTVLHIRGDGTVFNARSLLKSVNDQQGEQLSLF